MSTERLPDSMRALQLLGPDEFEVTSVDVPRPGHHEVLCRVHSVAICGTDTEIVSGHFLSRGWPRGYPYTPGHEWSGTVVALGEGAGDFGFSIGDRVAGTAHAGCGNCRMCITGRYNLCLNYGREDLGHHHYGHYSTGALRQFHNSSIKSVFPIPPSMTLEEAALVDAASIALHAVKRGRVESGDTVAIIGPGAQGLLAGQCAGVLGAARVIVVGRGERLTKAAELGMETVDNRATDGVAAVRELTGGLGADMTVDTAARGETPREAVGMTRKGGRVALIGVPLEPCILPLQRIVFEEMDVFGVRANPGTCEEIIPLIAAGKVNVATVTTHAFPLEDFGKAFETFTKRIDGALKVLVQPNAD
ncbi:MAG TPA: alcohol dehydrogenase catalytic domain-containing protein [Acidimicrobiia bacterium]